MAFLIYALILEVQDLDLVVFAMEQLWIALFSLLPSFHSLQIKTLKWKLSNGNFSIVLLWRVLHLKKAIYFFTPTPVLKQHLCLMFLLPK